jgi:hypothetical protein
MQFHIGKCRGEDVVTPTPPPSVEIVRRPAGPAKRWG